MADEQQDVGDGMNSSGEPMTSISIRGDEAYMQALKAACFAEGFPTIGDFVRAAIDRAYGEQMRLPLRKFRAKSGEYTLQSET